jgi:hypothetical protein
VSYPGSPDQPVALNEDGTFDSAQAALNQSDCSNAATDAQQAAADGLPWKVLPEYHPDTGVCARGRP